MIKNGREYQITKAQAARFERALHQQAPQERGELELLELSAIKSQLSELRASLEEYEALESGRLKTVEVVDLGELPRALIQARISSGLSQRELGEKLGIKEQQVQRYEATEYASASLSRLREVVRALGVQLHQDVLLPAADISLGSILKTLGTLGFDKTFVESRLMSGANDNSEDDSKIAWHTANIAARFLGVSAIQLASNTAISPPGLQGAMFKLPAGASEAKLPAYAAYARYLADLALSCFRGIAVTPLPRHPAEVRNAIISSFGSLTFESALRYIWSLGIPVLPLGDKGNFHGAFWRIGGRPVLVLKQRVSSNARWLVDLLHEFYHAVQTENSPTAEVLEMSESPFDRRQSKEEREATQWASAVLLGGRETELAQLCVQEAGHQVPQMKAAVQKVAAREGVAVDVLANYLAYRMAQEDQDWWGTATALQDATANPWETARDVFLESVELHRLDRLDRDLFTKALREQEN